MAAALATAAARGGRAQRHRPVHADGARRWRAPSRAGRPPSGSSTPASTGCRHRRNKATSRAFGGRRSAAVRRWWWSSPRIASARTARATTPARWSRRTPPTGTPPTQAEPRPVSPAGSGGPRSVGRDRREVAARPPARSGPARVTGSPRTSTRPCTVCWRRPRRPPARRGPPDPYGGAFKITRGLSTRSPTRPDHTAERGRDRRRRLRPRAGGGQGRRRDDVRRLRRTRLRPDRELRRQISLHVRPARSDAARHPLPLGRQPRLRPHPQPEPPEALHRRARPLAVRDVAVPRQPRLSRPHVRLEEPCLLFEDKVLYTRRMYEVDELFSGDLVEDVALVRFDGDLDYALIAPGGVAHRAIAAMRALLALPRPRRGAARPVAPVPVRPHRRAAAARAGGTGLRGGRTAARAAPGAATSPPTCTPGCGARSGARSAWSAPADSVIPTAAHLEQDVVLQDSTISRTVLEALDG